MHVQTLQLLHTLTLPLLNSELWEIIPYTLYLYVWFSLLHAPFNHTIPPIQ